MTPLSTPLPLRTSMAWGAFRSQSVLPRRYGDAVGGALIAYNAARTEFVWADHAVTSVDRVTVAGQVVGDWEWQNTTDSAGHPIALVRFGQPQDEGADLAASGRGMRHPLDGRPMTNPADVIGDVLALAGRAVPPATLESFRRAADAAGLFVGGSIEDSAESAQSVVRAICASVGAIFNPDMRGLCQLFPGGSMPAPRVRFSRGQASAAAAVDDLVNDLTIAYAWSAGEPGAALRLEAPDAVARYGRRTTTLDARWLTSARVALNVGRRLLSHWARPQWRVEFSPAASVSVGDAVAFAHPALPIAGTHLVLSRSADLDAGTFSAGVRVSAGDAPAIRLIQQSTAFGPQQYANASIATVGNERILTLREENGMPIAGASVTLDGRIQRTSDAGGRVSFPVDAMPPGEHVLEIATTDGRTLKTTVLIT